MGSTSSEVLLRRRGFTLLTALFSVCERKAREGTKTVNLKKDRRETRRERQLNQTSVSVWVRNGEGGRNTASASPSLSTLHRFHVTLPSLRSPLPSLLLALGCPVQRRCQPTNCRHSPAAPPTLILNFRVLLLAC